MLTRRKLASDEHRRQWSLVSGMQTHQLAYPASQYGQFPAVCDLRLFRDSFYGRCPMWDCPLFTQAQWSCSFFKAPKRTADGMGRRAGQAVEPNITPQKPSIRICISKSIQRRIWDSLQGWSLASPIKMVLPWINNSKTFHNETNSKFALIKVYFEEHLVLKSWFYRSRKLKREKAVNIKSQV